MSTSSAERAKAYRLRRKRSEGKNLGPLEAAWLAIYDRDHEAPEHWKPPTIAPDPPEQSSVSDQTMAPAAEARKAEESGFVPIDFGREPSEPAKPAAIIQSPNTPGQPGNANPNQCGIPNCPCKVQRGTQVCPNLGITVYPPIDDETAKWMAEGLLNLIGYLLRFFKADKYIVDPTDRDIKALAKGIQMLQTRRFPWLGAGEDFILTGMPIASYTKRAITTPKPAPPKSDDA